MKADTTRIAAGEQDPLALDQQVCFTLYALNRAVTARYRPLLDALGLTYPQYLVMLVLWEVDLNRQRAGGEDAPSGWVRVSDLGQRLRLDSGTLTPLLKRLEERGLLSRRRSADDERVVRIGLTDAGRLLREQARDVPERLLCELGVSAQDAGVFREQLWQLLLRLEQAAERSGSG